MRETSAPTASCARAMTARPGAPGRRRRGAPWPHWLPERESALAAIALVAALMVFVDFAASF